MNKNKILIVDDNADCRELFALLLRRSGYVVVEAATGLDALDQTHATHPDLILMDLCLPKMTGDAATAQLKVDPSTRNTPVIVCTALHRGALTERASAAGRWRFYTNLSPSKLFWTRCADIHYPTSTTAAIPISAGW
jgi:CheY-like chemotaxis protein